MINMRFVNRLVLAVICILPMLGVGVQASKPNIIFFYADDLGYGDLACYNAESEIKSPVLNKLAQNGVRFTDHYATAPLCSPSRRAFLTGRWQSRLGEWAEPYGGTPNLDGIPADKEPTVAMFLKNAGYATGCFGKWNIGGVNGVSRPGAHGFDEYICVDHNTDYFYHQKWDGQKDLFNDGLGLYTNGGKPKALAGKYLPDVFADAAIEFIEGNKERPFFIYLPWCVPHSPMQGPDDINDTKDNPIGKVVKGQHNRETFVKMVEYMDLKTGQILATLKQHGLIDNTLIIFSSDNGGQVLGNREPLRGYKHMLFEGGIRVPLIAHWPAGIKGKQARRTVAQPTIMMDVTQTILEAAGATATRKLDGKSLIPWMNNQAPAEDRLFGWPQRVINYGKKQNYLRAEAARYGNLKYVKETRPKGKTPAQFPFTEYLFDLSSDIGEQHNLAQSNPKQLALMRRKYAQWRADTVNVDNPIFVNPFPDQYGNPTPEQIKTINTHYYQKERAVPHVNSGSENISASENKVSLCPTAHNAKCKRVTVDGRFVWQSVPPEEGLSRYFYFDVQDSLLKNGNAKSATITVTYKDQFSAPLFLQYDSTDQKAEQGGIWKRTDGVTTGNSGAWKTISWTLDDALFRSRCHGHDFRIAVGADVDFVIADCTLAGTPKQTLIVPDIFSDNMILQRNAPIGVWGKADDGTVVTVTFAGHNFESTTTDGKWRVVLPPMKANKVPQTMRIESTNNPAIQFANIVIGDVWLASGQSNMEMGLSQVKGGMAAVAASKNPMLRLFKVPKCLENTVAPVGTTWHASNPNSSHGQTAVGWFFASELQKETDIPIGLLNCSYGGTVTETWCSPEVLAQGWPIWDAYEKQAVKNPQWHRRNTSSDLYNRMLKTVMGFPVKGFIWYQGEANAGRAEEQKKLFPAMVADWRNSWGNGELPFYIVQLARYEAANWHAFRCAQLDVWKNTPNSYMAVTIDLSKDWNADNHPIHPTTKAPIGHRLALAARANVYGEAALVYSGPIIRSMQVKNGAAVLSFDHIGSGLVASDGQPLRGFYLSADGETFVAAVAQIKGDTVVVQSANVREPVAVRYGAEADIGQESLDVNLANKEMLPASPFTVF